MVGGPHAQGEQKTVFRFLGHALGVDNRAAGAEYDGVLQFNGRMRMVEHIVYAVALIGFRCPRQLLDGTSGLSAGNVKPGWLMTSG